MDISPDTIDSVVRGVKELGLPIALAFGAVVLAYRFLKSWGERGKK